MIARIAIKRAAGAPELEQTGRAGRRLRSAQRTMSTDAAPSFSGRSRRR